MANNGIAKAIHESTCNHKPVPIIANNNPTKVIKPIKIGVPQSLTQALSLTGIFFNGREGE